MEEKVANAECGTGNSVTGNKYRFSMLTSRLVRIEYSENGVFEDRPTIFAINRDFGKTAFITHDYGDTLEIHTEYLSICYNKKEFTPGGLFIKVRSKCRGIYSTWRYGEQLNENLGGTARTLDQADGAIPLENGVQSRLQGYSIIDDSNSMILFRDGMVEPRNHQETDIYFFGYGYAYQECMSDFFHLSGKPPMLPRFALGNWWSRFYPYTSVEYCELMDRFSREKIPLSVAVIDMDWHITSVDPKYGKGWTGYTWNNELVPDPEGFLGKLHEKNLKVTLNIHPAEGIQPHEKLYEAAARALGREPEEKLSVPFDFCDEHYRNVYFNILLKPIEENGVDFWWIDWQQGENSRVTGADPLWLLNHFHYLENTLEGRRPLILSRYAGPGSHRYPIGFSGDTIMSWKSLKFQPYFTATASNIGYGWWSHDIGGHCSGKKDPELMVRWIQFGAFSPVMRLHSTSNLFNGKEPWNYEEPAYGIIKQFLRLRHRLVPYVYTLNYIASEQGVLPVRPMYYGYPEADAAYEVPNQYFFGDQLIICPVTDPADPDLCMGHATVWLPEGIYYDFFTMRRYTGNRKINMYRPLETIPVLAKAGAVIPLSGIEEAEQNGTELPATMEILTFCGCSGEFFIYEDDGISSEGKSSSAITRFSYEENGNNATLLIIPMEDRNKVRPKERRFTVTFVGITFADAVAVEKIHGEKVPCTFCSNRNGQAFTVSVSDTIDSAEGFYIHLHGMVNGIPDEKKSIYEILHHSRLEYELKEKIYRCLTDPRRKTLSITELETMELSPSVLGALSEVLFAE